MTKLDEIIEKVSAEQNVILVSKEREIIKQIVLEIAKHILEEAAENAELGRDAGQDLNGIFVNKQSITDTINKYL